MAIFATLVEDQTYDHIDRLAIELFPINRLAIAIAFNLDL